MILQVKPAAAYSRIAEDFLRECRKLDAKFPPEGWTKEDLRAAANEILDYYETGNGKSWPVSFCLIALGYTASPEDIDRILIYEEKMPQTVLLSLDSVSNPKAIECLLRHATPEHGERELAYRGLGKINFELLDEPDKWHAKIKERLTSSLKKEKAAWLSKMIIKSLDKIEASAIKAHKKKDKQS